jgi:hypothetical protein
LLEIVGRDFVKRNFGVRNFAAVLFYIFLFASPRVFGSVNKRMYPRY